jgi:hypothetical protein
MPICLSTRTHVPQWVRTHAAHRPAAAMYDASIHRVVDVNQLHATHASQVHAASKHPDYKGRPAASQPTRR